MFPPTQPSVPPRPHPSIPPSPPSSNCQDCKAHLVTINPQVDVSFDSPQTCHLKDSENSFGRSSDNTFVISRLTIVSRRHFSIKLIEKTWQVQDSSTNGITVNDFKTKSSILRTNDVIGIGVNQEAREGTVWKEHTLSFRFEIIRDPTDVVTSPSLDQPTIISPLSNNLSLSSPTIPIKSKRRSSKKSSSSSSEAVTTVAPTATTTAAPAPAPATIVTTKTEVPTIAASMAAPIAKAEVSHPRGKRSREEFDGESAISLFLTIQEEFKDHPFFERPISFADPPVNIPIDPKNSFAPKRSVGTMDFAPLDLY